MGLLVGGCPTVVADTLSKAPTAGTKQVERTEKQTQAGHITKGIPASLPAGEALAAGPASVLSVLSASASLSLKHRSQNNMKMCRV